MEYHIFIQPELDTPINQIADKNKFYLNYIFITESLYQLCNNLRPQRVKESSVEKSFLIYLYS